MPPLFEGQEFPTLRDFKEALHRWAIERNFTPRILDSDSHRVRVGCRSGPDCPFRVRVNFREARGNAKITTCDDAHTCESTQAGGGNQAIKRAETGKMKFLADAVPAMLNVTENTHTSEIMRAVEQKYRQKISSRQAQKVKRVLVERVKGNCIECEKGKALKNCPHRPRIADATGDPNIDLHRRLQDYANSGVDRINRTGSVATSTAVTENSVTHQSAIDPGLRDDVSQLNLPEGEPLNENSSHVDPSLNDESDAWTRTAQEARMEAARLMQKAADLMQEAARMNSEAARLTASVAGS